MREILSSPVDARYAYFFLDPKTTFFSNLEMIFYTSFRRVRPNNF